MRKQAGVWEIKNWQGITYSNGVITKDTSIADMGYLALYNSGLNGQNQTHYHLTYTPPCWLTFTEQGALLDNLDDVCWWQSDDHVADRFSLITLDSWGAYKMMMFTVKHINKDKQEWIYITSGNDTTSSMSAKEVFTIEPVSYTHLTLPTNREV